MVIATRGRDERAEQARGGGGTGGRESAGRLGRKAAGTKELGGVRHRGVNASETSSWFYLRFLERRLSFRLRVDLSGHPGGVFMFSYRHKGRIDSKTPTLSSSADYVVRALNGTKRPRKTRVSGVVGTGHRVVDYYLGVSATPTCLVRCPRLFGLYAWTLVWISCVCVCLCPRLCAFGIYHAIWFTSSFRC